MSIEIGLPHIDVGEARVPDAITPPVVGLHLLPGELLVVPQVDSLMDRVGVHLRDVLIPR